jgi:biotin carboxylase
MNYDNLRDKKLLILGGNPETGILVQIANSLGIITLVADPYISSPSKEFAYKSINIDVMDINKVVQIAKNEKVDGVLVGVADPLVASYMRICKELSLPCYVNEKSLIAFTSKDGFISTCEKYNVPTTPRYDINDKFDYPVIVKPVDSGAGVGITICHNQLELKTGVKFAIEKSTQKRFIIEKFMKADDLGVYYTFINGEVFLSAMYDRYKTLKYNSGSPVCIGAIYPSKLLNDFMKKMHPKLLNMLKNLEIDNGVLNIQFFHENGIFYAYDPGFRLQGEAPHLHLKYSNNFDHRKMLINFALTGKMYDQDFSTLNDVKFNNLNAITIWILLTKGKILNIKGLDEISTLDSYCAMIQRFKIGDIVEESMIGTERQVFARIYLQNRDINILKTDVNKIAKLIEIIDEDKNSQIFDMFTFKENSKC